MASARLGAPVFRGSDHCPTCLSGHSDVPPILDELGHHAAICKGGIGAVSQHKRLRDILHHEISHPAISLSVKRERVHAADLRKSPTERRALDFVIDDFLFAPSPMALDVTTVSPHSAPYGYFADNGVSTLDRAEKKKVANYSAACDQEGLEIIPLAIDIYGQIGKCGLKALQDLSNLVADRRGKHRLSEFHSLRTCISSFVL